MFTKANGQLALTVFIAASAALIFHQLVTSPRLTKKVTAEKK